MRKQGAFCSGEGHAQGVKGKDWLRTALALVLSASLITQGIPVQAIAEEATDSTLPAVESVNEPEAPSDDKTDDVIAPEDNAASGGEEAVDDESATEDSAEPDDKNTPAVEDNDSSAGNPDDQKALADDADGQKAPENKGEEPKSTAIDFTTTSSNDVIVKIHAPEGAFPAGTKPVVRPADASALMAAASDLVEGEPVDARAVDICFMKGGAEVEPAQGKSVSVSLRLLAPVTGETFSAVHLDDNGSAEVVDEDATRFGASFDAKEFSVYGIVAGSVEEGPKEEYTRLKVVFRNAKNEGKGGAIVSTQIVHEGDKIEAPDVTPNVATEVHPEDPSQVVVYPTFKSWTANDTAVDAATYFGKALTEDDIQSFISAYGATKSSEYDNLYEVTLVADYEDGYRAYFHKYSHRSGSESATYNGVILGSLSTKNQQVNLGDFTDYDPPTETDVLIGWNAYDTEGKLISIDGKELFSTTDTVTLSDDTDFYPVLAEGVSVALEMNGSASLDNVLAVYDETTGKNVLELSDLPSAVSAENYYPGYEFGGWYTDSGLESKITESSPAIFEPGTTNAKVYAKWTPKEGVTYKIAFLAEDEKGKPGEGNFTVYRTDTRTGTAGSTIPKGEYENETLDGYHHLLATADEINDAKLNHDAETKAKLNGYLTSNTEATTIKGDGSTIKLVYYTYNRLRFCCDHDDKDHIFNNFFTDVWAKPGESIETWLGGGGFSNQPYCNYISMSTSGGGTKKYVKDDTGYVFDGTQTTIPYVSNNCADTTKIEMVASSGDVRSMVIGQHYYECISGEKYDKTVLATVNGEEKQFYLDHTVEWGTFARLSEHPDESFGNTAQGGGLVERAYKAASYYEGEGAVYDLPESTSDPEAAAVGKPGKIRNAERYNQYYYDHYYVRARSNLSFWNTKSSTPDDPIRQDTVAYGEAIAHYLPGGYTENKTTCTYGGNTYTFVGWYTDQTAANNPNDASSSQFKLAADATMPKSNQDIYAGWQIKTYTVTFNAMGGTFAGGDSTHTENVKSGQRVQRPNDPTHASEAGEQPYEFAGWYKDKDYKESWNFDTDVVHEDTTIYARWYHEKTWTIEYYRADNTVKPSWEDHFTEGAQVYLDAPDEDTYNGKPFLGWALKVGDGDSDDDYLVVPNVVTVADVEGDQQVIKLYARYGDAPLMGAPTVTYHSNYPDQEGAGDTATVLADPETPNGQVTLPDYTAIGFTRPKGHKFIGWGNTADGSDKVYAANKPVGVSGEPGENTDLYAIWEYQEYTITFVDDDGTELQSGKVAYGEMPEYTGETPTKADDDQYTYTFSGWEPEVATVTGEATYTATYTATPKTATLTFDLAGGTLDGKTGKVTMTAKIGETVKLLKAPTRDGYTFKYWKGSQYDAGAEYKVTGDHTFTAVWEKNATSKPVSKKTAKATLPKTSDPTSVATMTVLAIVGIAAIALGWRKRRQNEA